MLDHDVAWYLVATRNWLEGARLYVDIIEVNPPLNFYLTVPAILIADATGFGDQNAQYISFSILLFISLFWCWKIRENVEGITTGQRILFQLFIALAVVMPALGALTQRDHIFTVFLLPWLIGFLPSSKKPPIRSQIARAAFAGLGICLKPHFLIFPISVFLWQCWLKRSLRPLREPWLLAQGIIGLTYVSYVFFVHPEYFSDTIPLGALVYGSYGFSDRAVLAPIFSMPAKFVFISLLLALLSRNRPPSLGLFVVLTVAGLGTYLSQWKGYPYQLIPFYSVSILGLGWLVVAVPGWSPSRIAAVTTLFMICAVKLLLGPYHNAGTVLLGDRVRGQSSVTALTTDLFVGPAVAFYAGAEWSSRYPALWLVPGVVNNIDGTDCAVEVERCETLGHIAERTRRDFVSDLKTFKPEAIIVDNQPMYIIDKNFDWWTFMEPNPEFAKIMGNYRLEQSMERFDIWVLR
ncbi:MAG: hypothetical protein OEZ19_07935 [Paracoccaceae bacterium]|nr:hypothetical protein [Paracoccaceae bacterium]